MLRMLQALVALTGYELLALGVDDATEATALLSMVQQVRAALGMDALPPSKYEQCRSVGPERTDRTVMIALLESDIYNSERRRVWATSPTLYVPAAAPGLMITASVSLIWFSRFLICFTSLAQCDSVYR